MTYPKATDYVAAVQDPAALLDPDLARASFRLHPVLRIPVPASGNSAVVFRAEIEGRSYALRFFIRDDASSRDSYNTLHKFVQRHQLTDCTATTQWIDDAIRVNGQRWPMVKMEWVDGRALDAYVDALVQDRNRVALRGLATTWLQLVRRMQDVRFAHGDLQHGNVLVDNSSRLRLVDFDGCWTPDSVGPSPTETGHPNYQLNGRPWGRWMDTFPGLLVHTALSGLAREPDLWKTYGSRENILFVKDDFLRPFETPIWSDLRSLGDPGVTQSLIQLSAACGAGSGLTLPLAAVIDGRAEPSQRASDSGPSRSGPYRSSPLVATPWWEKTGWTPGQASTGAASATGGLPPTGPRSTNLPPPPPPKAQPQADPRFGAAHSGPWHGQTARANTGAAGGSGGSGAAGAGGRAKPGGPGGWGTTPPTNQGSGGVSSPIPPRPPKKKTRWVLVLVVIVLILLLIMIVGCVSAYSYDASSSGPATSDPSRTASSSPSTIETSTSSSPASSSETDLLLTRVPYPLSEECKEIKPREGNPAVAALACAGADVSITVAYYAYESTADLKSTYESTYSTNAQGTCQSGEAGSGRYVDSDGDRLGDYSCYATKDYNVLTWTHEPHGILAVAYSATVPYPKLIEWTDAHAGPRRG